MNGYSSWAATAKVVALILGVVLPAAAQDSPAPTPTPEPKGWNPFSNAYNPALSINGLFLAGGSDLDDPAATDFTSGIHVQELELQALANVDPYFSATITLALPGGKDIELEEGYLTPAFQPAGFQSRFGKMKEPFGRENTQHAHALPFLEPSLVESALFGEEGLNEVGLEISYLFPFPWYSVLSGQVMNGDNEVLFASPSDGDLAGLGHLKSVFDLTEDATIESGFSYTAGENQDQRLSQAYGADLTMKWRPARQARSHSLIVSTEAMYAAHRGSGLTIPHLPETPNHLGGIMGYTQWQLAQRWFVGARYDFLGFSEETVENLHRQSAILAFAPTEFSAFRLQTSVMEYPDQPTAVEAFLQVNFTLGAHPAHGY